jgi:hypothetical protein
MVSGGGWTPNQFVALNCFTLYSPDSFGGRGHSVFSIITDTKVRANLFHQAPLVFIERLMRRNIERHAIFRRIDQ